MFHFYINTIHKNYTKGIIMQKHSKKTTNITIFTAGHILMTKNPINNTSTS